MGLPTETVYGLGANALDLSLIHIFSVIILKAYLLYHAGPRCQRRPAAARRFFYICFAPRAAATVDNPVGMPYYGGWEYTHTNFGGNADEIAEDEPTLASDRLRHGGGLRADLPGAHGPRGGRRGVGLRLCGRQ